MTSQLFEHDAPRGTLDWGNPDPTVVDQRNRAAEEHLDGTWKDKRTGGFFVHAAGQWMSGDSMDNLFNSLGPLHMEDLERLS